MLEGKQAAVSRKVLMKAGDAMSDESIQIFQRLDRIENMLGTLVDRATIKEFYEIEEFARLVGREPFTCREWARLGRIKAEKKASGRGPHARWAVSHDEFLRYQRCGLLHRK